MSNIDLDKLLEIASKEEKGQLDTVVPDGKKSKYYNDVVKYIKKNQIRSGEIRIPVYRLMYSYYVENATHSSLKASRIEFGRIMSKFFKTSRSGKYRYYLLEPFCDMSKETMKKAKKYYRKYHLLRKNNVKK